MPRPRRILIPALAAAAATGAALAGAASATPKHDDPPSKARVSPASPARHGLIHLTFRARYDSYRATYVVKTLAPRAGCVSVRKVRFDDGEEVHAGDRMDFWLRAPKAGWCRGVHRVYLIAHADVDMSDGDCETYPESGSSACPEELEPVMAIDRRTRFVVR